jgi:hypothetical protein
MARLRSAGDVDARSYYLDFLLRSYETKFHPDRMAARLAAVRAGKPFVASGWKLGRQPMHTPYCVETNGTVVEVEDVVRDGVHHYVRANGTEVLPC